MAWDEWEQLKRDNVERHGQQMHLNQLPPEDRLPTSGVTGGLKSVKQVWNKAGEDVGGLADDVRRALDKLEAGQSGLTDNEAGCLTAGAQNEVYDSWTRYLKGVSDRCGSVRDVLQQVGHDLLLTDDAVRTALTSIDTEFADTAAVGGHGSGR